MPTKNLLITYIVVTVAFFIIDMIWLQGLMKKFYANNLSAFMQANPKLIAAGIFYLLYPIGIMVFSVIPGFEAGSLNKTLLLGFLLGIIAYATYDLTNWAVLKDWPVKIVIIDILWGGTVTMLGAWIGNIVSNKIK